MMRQPPMHKEKRTMNQFEITKLLKTALNRVSVSTKAEMLKIIEPLELRTYALEDERLAHRIRSACVALRNASGKGDKSDAFGFAVQDILKVERHIRQQG
jgi:hypothetical protein